MYLFLKKSYASDEHAYCGVRVKNTFFKKRLVTTDN